MTMPMLWNDFIKAEKQQDYLRKTLEFIESERQAGKVIYPPSVEVFSAFELTPLADVRVVIIGQDPYHGPNQAHGLSFSVLPDVKVPPSLVNIYKELKRDIPEFDVPVHGCLKSWAVQGVLLLNTVLTVEQGKAHSHAKTGWEQFTDRVIGHINTHCRGVIFLLWGAHAQKKGSMIDRDRHLILTAAHPSPLSAYRGFLGCGHFSQVNHYLASKGKPPINWQPTLD
jgi:uracil-DNA glycosylase